MVEFNNFARKLAEAVRLGELSMEDAGELFDEEKKKLDKKIDTGGAWGTTPQKKPE